MSTYEVFLQAKGYVQQTDGSWSKPKRVVSDICTAPSPEPEQAVVCRRDESVPRKAIYPGRVLISIESFCCGTQRDADNICPKFFIDCLRHAGIIRDDTPGCIAIAPIKETRVSTKKEEGCLIVITPL